MNGSDQSSIRMMTEANQYTVAPGGRLELPLILKNLATSPDQVQITVEGIPLTWVSTDQPLLLIQPGEERRVALIIQPPAPPNANAGRHRLQIAAASTLDPRRPR